MKVFYCLTACLSSSAESLNFHRASTALSRRKFCIEKEKKVSKNNPRAPLALGPRRPVLQFSTELARNAFFLSALSPREFRCATEAGSYIALLQLNSGYIIRCRVWVHSKFHHTVHAPCAVFGTTSCSNVCMVGLPYC